MGLIPVNTGSSKWFHVLQHHSKFSKVFIICGPSKIWTTFSSFASCRAMTTSSIGSSFPTRMAENLIMIHVILLLLDCRKSFRSWLWEIFWKKSYGIVSILNLKYMSVYSTINRYRIGTLYISIKAWSPNLLYKKIWEVGFFFICFHVRRNSWLLLSAL